MSSSENKSILLVEDESIMALVTTKNLQARGYAVHHVSSGEEAVAAVVGRTVPIDLILMDIDLGSGMDGTRAAQLILEHEEIPVVFLSSHTEPEIVEKTEQITSYGYVVKNSGTVVLDASIKMALKLFAAGLEQERVEERLRTSDKRFFRMLGVVPDMVSIHDPQMNILYSNWKGYAAVPAEKRILHTKCYSTYRGYTDICPDCRAKEVLQTKTAITEVHRLPEGVWIELRVIPILDEQGGVESFVEWIRDISGQKQVEESLRDSETRIRSYFEHAPYGVFVTDADGKYLEVNPMACQMTGYSAEELITMSIPDLLYPEDMETGLSHFQKLLETGKSYGVTRFITKDGTVRWWTIAANKISDQLFLGFCEDVTERKLVEEDLQAAKQQLQLISDNMLDMVAVTDLQGNFKFAGRSHRALGYEIESLIGKNVMDFVHPEDVPEVQHKLGVFLSGRSATGEAVYRYRRADGSYIWLESKGTFVLDEAGSPEEILFNTRDVTERRQIEEELKKQLREKELLLREVNHRIKNNIGNIEGLIFLQAETADNPTTKTALEETLARVRSMRVLYEKLLLSNAAHELSIKSYIEDLIGALFEVFVLPGGIRLEIRIADFSLSSRQAVPLGIIVTELLTNVVKYAFNDNDSGTVSVTVEEEDGTATLTVQDSGIGIGSRSGEECGFGLSIIEMLAEQLHGSSSWEQENGTRCVVQFPL